MPPLGVPPAGGLVLDLLPPLGGAFPVPPEGGVDPPAGAGLPPVGDGGLPPPAGGVLLLPEGGPPAPRPPAGFPERRRVISRSIKFFKSSNSSSFMSAKVLGEPPALGGAGGLPGTAGAAVPPIPRFEG